MCETAWTLRYNALPLSSMAAFAGISGGLHGDCKDVYFLRLIGCNENYLQDIADMDALLCARQARGQGAYLRLGALPRLCQPEDVAAVLEIYDRWTRHPAAAPSLSVTAQQTPLGPLLAAALRQIQQSFVQYSPGATDSMTRNLLSKLLFWLDGALRPLLDAWQAGAPGKFVWTGSVGKAEYLLCYLLTLIGVDVAILSPGGPLDLDAGLLALSAVVHLGAAGEPVIPAVAAMDSTRQISSVDRTPQPAGQGLTAAGKVDIRRPDRPRRPKDAHIAARAPLLTVSKSGEGSRPDGRQELAFEQLAQLASSIVMITVHDQTGQSVSGGSGIMVGAEGYILTNHHVACRGCAYSVHVEDDPHVYQTSELIKTHALVDLALLRIARPLRPLPVYQGARPLVRGQKVVAIGSPLGLFNSVSDGIIAGFRSFDEVDMIQFTAPISPGSSGGAVLNMYGEVIGISTAGIDRGQNLNLAVGHQSILPFIRGFVK